MIILTAITNYNVNDIRPFVESLNKSGYVDGKVALIYDVSTDAIEYLKLNGWELYKSNLKEHIILQRFIDAYSLLDNYKNEIVFWTDIKDVIFQRNPIDWVSIQFDNYWNKSEILAFSECIRLKDDPWACINSGTTFPLEWEWNKNNISYCAGTILGRGYALKDLFNEIYRWSKTTSNPDQLSDQAAYNVLIRLNHFKHIVEFVEQENGFVTQLGTVWCKQNEFSDHLTEPTPLWKDGLLCNKKGEPFYVVHQYDRDPFLKNEYLNRFK
jgi:hypothetical protein